MQAGSDSHYRAPFGYQAFQFFSRSPPRCQPATDLSQPVQSGQVFRSRYNDQQKGIAKGRVAQVLNLYAVARLVQFLKILGNLLPGSQPAGRSRLESEMRLRCRQVLGEPCTGPGEEQTHTQPDSYCAFHDRFLPAAWTVPEDIDPTASRFENRKLRAQSTIDDFLQNIHDFSV